MQKKKLTWIVGVACIAFNAVSVCFFFKRDSFGNFTRVASYEILYSPSYNTEEELKKWRQGADGFSKDTLEEGRRLTTVHAGVQTNDPTLTKINKIGSWLRRSFSHCEIGKPTDHFNRLPVLQQLKAAAVAASPIWCGTYGYHFMFFCYANGIDVRYIESKAEIDHHVVNEVFVPELNQWVLTDLTNNVLYCTDANNKILNTVDVLYLNAKDDSSAITAYGQAGNDSLLILPRQEYGKLWQKHLNSFHQLFYYYTTDLRQVYEPVSKIIRYIYPTTWFEIFSLNPISNFTFYLRIVFLYVGFVLLMIFIPLVLKHNDRSKKYKKEFR